MRHNISAGRLRHLIKFHNIDLSSTDKHGNPDGAPIMLFDARANVKVDNGTQVEGGGGAYTDQRVTALMWYDERLTTAAKFMWNNTAYDVVNIQPSEDNRSMIITGKFSGLIQL